MKTIKPFIDLGWHTVPLTGELKRLSNGKKTIPKFPHNWRDYYADNKNKDATEIGGVITGPCSNIIAIDCDNEETYKIFRALDPDYEGVFVSIGKQDAAGNEMEAGAIIYEYTDELEENFLIHNNSLSLDFYSTRGFVYLPTNKNKSKVPWKEVVKIKPAPKAVVALLKTLKPVKIKESEEKIKSKQGVYHLFPQVEMLLSKKKADPRLFKILTPKDFRDTPEYIETGWLHPKDVAEGRGSEYLSKVSAILGADESIDEVMYQSAMELINSFFKEPMKNSRLQSTIIEPMMEERSQINGEVIWRYNESWQEGLTVLVTKLNDSLHLFYDMQRRMYYCVNVIDEKLYDFFRDSDLFSFLEATIVEPPSKKELKSALPLVDVISSPQYPFGFYGEDNSVFNTFRPTIPLTIFKDPKTYKNNYTYPSYLLQFIEYLIPDDFMRNYFYKFLRRKLDKFEYSPIVLYFLGASGSGKDLLVSIISRIIGEDCVAKPNAKEFIEKHNGWMLDKYFAQLDEYGDQLHRAEDQEIAKGLIKTYSGSQQTQIRQMRTDGFNYTHNITFILTANRNPLTFDADDRRVALFNCPTALRFQPKVEEIGLETFVGRVLSEVNDFAYWLAIDQQNATLEEYQVPPDTAEKQKLIAARLNAGAAIAYYLSNSLFQELQDLAVSHGVEDLFDSAAENRVYEEPLFDLYSEMTNGQGTKRGLTLAMGIFEKLPTTRNQMKAYYYKIPNLKAASVLQFGAIETTDKSTAELKLK